MRKFFVFVSLFIVSHASFALDPNEIQTKIQNLSPMPERPTIIGSRFGYYYLLEKLREGIEGRLNPADSENYLYRRTPSLAIDTSAEFQAHIDLYEHLLKDYKELLATGEIDRYANLGQRWFGPGEIPFPARYDLPFEVAEKLAGHSFITHYRFVKVLTILHKQLVDDRYISEFLFWATIRPGHRPLESMNSLSRSSVRSQMLLKGLVSRFQQSISEVSSEFVTLTNKVLNGETDIGLRDQLFSTDLKKQELCHRLEYLNDSLYRAVQFANDIVRDKEIGASDLETIAANLGDQLQESIADVGVFREELQKIQHIDFAVPRRRSSAQGRLTDTYRELIQILGLQGHVGGVTVFKDLKSRYPELPYQMFQDTVILQHILALGSVMAKISEIPEGRGNWYQRLSQEVSFRRAQMQSYRNSAGNSLVVLDQRDPKGSLIQRRDFAAPELASRRTEIEEKLWQIFFEHARLELDSARTCELLFIAGPHPQSENR